MDVELFFNYIFDDAIARKSRNGKLPNKIFLLFPKQIGREIYIKLSKLNGNLNIWQDRLIFKFSHFLKDESDRGIIMQALEESFIVDIPKSKSEAYQRISEVMRELGHSVKPYN